MQGILPSSLSRSGLQGAVRTLVSRATLPVRVDVPPDRFAPAIEATAYFIISEALTNTFKHAHARHATVRVAEEAGELQIEVADDGLGGAQTAAGRGLAGLEDRASALGGRLAVDSLKGRGTRVRAFLPLPDEAR